MSDDDDPQRQDPEADSGAEDAPGAAEREEEARPQRFRRRLLGARPADVSAALESRDHEIEELRRDVAGLWLAFGQHERTIYELLATVERLAGVGSLERQAAPSPRPAPAIAPPPTPEAQPAPESPPSAEAPPSSVEARGTPDPPPAAAPVRRASLSPPDQSAADPGPLRSHASRPDRPPLAASITDQLSDLDEVLAAIEQATNSLEQTYEERIADDSPADREGPSSDTGDGEPGPGTA